MSRELSQIPLLAGLIARKAPAYAREITALASLALALIGGTAFVEGVML